MSTGRLPSTDGGIQPTVVDAKGDLLVGVAADSISRLAVGSNDQVLTADSSTSTGLKWAAPGGGGMTLLTTSSWSSGVVTISNIDQTYTDLMIEVYGVTLTGGVSAQFAIRPNGQSSGFRGGLVKVEGTTPGTSLINGQFNLDAGVGQIYGVGGVNNWIIYCYDYTNTSANRNFFVNGMYQSTSTTRATLCGPVGYESTSALTSIEWAIAGGNTANGGTVKVWGIK